MCSFALNSGWRMADGWQRMANGQKRGTEMDAAGSCPACKRRQYCRRCNTPALRALYQSFCAAVAAPRQKAEDGLQVLLAWDTKDKRHGVQACLTDPPVDVGLVVVK